MQVYIKAYMYLTFLTRIVLNISFPVSFTSSFIFMNCLQRIGFSSQSIAVLFIASTCAEIE